MTEEQIIEFILPTLGELTISVLVIMFGSIIILNGILWIIFLIINISKYI